MPTKAELYAQMADKVIRYNKLRKLKKAKK